MNDQPVSPIQDILKKPLAQALIHVVLTMVEIGLIILFVLWLALLSLGFYIAPAEFCTGTGTANAFSQSMCRWLRSIWFWIPCTLGLLLAFIGIRLWSQPKHKIRFALLALLVILHFVLINIYGYLNDLKECEYALEYEIQLQKCA